MVQKKLPLINAAHGSDTRNIINELIRLFNTMGYTYDEALQKSHDILNEAQQTNDMNKAVDERLDNIIADSGTSSTEVVDARGDYAVLGGRLNSTENNLIQRGINITQPPFNVSPDGTADNTAEIQSVVDYVQSQGGGRIIVPKMANPYVIKAESPTINNPKRVLITSDDIHIQGVGTPVFKMTGITKEYLDSIDDQSSSGRDVFNVFTFHGVNGGSAYGLKVIGDWDGVGVFRYASPRAKAIGFVGSKNCKATNITGEGILGNLINATPASSAIDGFYRVTENIQVADCHGVRCLENGINFMGNTFDCSISDSSGKYCGSAGFEGASKNLKVSNFTGSHNKLAGISLSGDFVNVDAITVFENGDGTGSTSGTGVLITAGSNIKLNSGSVFDNEGFGLQVYSGIDGFSIAQSVHFKDNGTSGGHNSAISIVGSLENPIKNIKMANFKIEDTLSLISYGINMSYCEFGDISTSDITLTKAGSYSVYIQGSNKNIFVKNNRTNRLVSISSNAENCHQYGNRIKPKVVELGSLPTNGDWLIDDVVEITNASSGRPMEYVCISSGAPGSWRMTKQKGVMKGATEYRPPNLGIPETGLQYIDTTLNASGKLIVWSGTYWTDVSGTTV